MSDQDDLRNAADELALLAGHLETVVPDGCIPDCPPGQLSCRDCLAWPPYTNRPT
jgi:hypothetical protein